MRKVIWVTAIICLLLGGFLMGSAISHVLVSQEPKRDYWLGQGDSQLETIADDEKKDEWNRLLIDNRNYMTINKALIVDPQSAKTVADISNARESDLGCTVTIIRDSTSEILYQSKLIDPGNYIAEIQLYTKLRKGYYPCTVIWSFYIVGEDIIIGEMAEKAVVIIND